MRWNTSRKVARARLTADSQLQELIAGLPAALCEQVFTHSSWADHRRDSYERLEFLGDSVLGLAIAGATHERFPDHSEGHLAKLRANVVSRKSCAEVGLRLGLGAQLAQRGSSLPAEELERLATNSNVLAALLEASLGALYLVYGFDSIQAAIVAAFEVQLDYAVNSYVDFKTELQETLARLGRQVNYTVTSIEGPPHQRSFTCAAMVDGEQYGSGKGSSKKEAEQAAAGEALARLGAG
jgi:ribonuclease-3